MATYRMEVHGKRDMANSFHEYLANLKREKECNKMDKGCVSDTVFAQMCEDLGLILNTAKNKTKLGVVACVSNSSTW